MFYSHNFFLMLLVLVFVCGITLFMLCGGNGIWWGFLSIFLMICPVISSSIVLYTSQRVVPQEPLLDIEESDQN